RVDPQFLAAWLNHLGVSSTGSAKLEGMLTQRLDKAGAYDFVQGWGIAGIGDLSILANKSEQAVRIPGHAKPHGVVVHPGPDRALPMVWASRIAGAIRVEAEVVHAHPDCGNGGAWSSGHRRGATQRSLKSGNVDLGKAAAIEPIEATVRAGEMISL